MSSQLTPRTYRLPASWAPYLINGDATGLETAERRQADDFLTLWKLDAPVSCEPDGFRAWNDAHSLGGSAALGQDCEEYTFLVTPDWFTK
jgi:hypothetical protein